MITVYDAGRLGGEMICGSARLFLYTNPSPWQLLSLQVPLKQPFVSVDFHTRMTLLGPVRWEEGERANNTGFPAGSLWLITRRV